jgi:hypothetical protein
VSVIADAYLAGVSTRRVEKLVQQLGVERMSKSQVSRLAKSLDQIVEDFRTRPLEGAPYAYVTLDALEIKCREGGRTVNVCVVHAVGVNHDGFRESLGLDVVTSEDGAGWLAFLRSLVARGLSGVRLASSDAHPGLVAAIAATLPGAAWQRCRTHFMRNLLTQDGGSLSAATPGTEECAALTSGNALGLLAAFVVGMATAILALRRLLSAPGVRSGAVLDTLALSAYDHPLVPG